MSVLEPIPVSINIVNHPYFLDNFPTMEVKTPILPHLIKLELTPIFFLHHGFLVLNLLENTAIHINIFIINQTSLYLQLLLIYGNLHIIYFMDHL